MAKKSKGWLYHIECPEDWSNASAKGIYQIIEAPHVREANRNPQWQCLECGVIVQGQTPPDECPGCQDEYSQTIGLEQSLVESDTGLLERLRKACCEMLAASGPWHHPLIIDKGEDK